MKIVALVIPALFLFSFVYAAGKKVNVYETFVGGVKKAPPLILSVFPYIAAIMMLSTLFEKSGLSAALSEKTAPLFAAAGVPAELMELILVKPLSGSGATAVLSRVLAAHGTDSYIGRCACVIFGGNETIFYVSAVYFSSLKHKKITAAIFICVISYLFSVIFACFLCRIM